MRLRTAGALLKSLEGSFFLEGGEGEGSHPKKNDRCEGGHVEKMVAEEEGWGGVEGSYTFF